jgi:hypothetical protein
MGSALAAVTPESVVRSLVSIPILP